MINATTGATPGNFSLDLVILDRLSDLVIFHSNLVLFCKGCVRNKTSDLFF